MKWIDTKRFFETIKILIVYRAKGLPYKYQNSLLYNKEVVALYTPTKKKKNYLFTFRKERDSNPRCP